MSIWATITTPHADEDDSADYEPEDEEQDESADELTEQELKTIFKASANKVKFQLPTVTPSASASASEPARANPTESEEKKSSTTSTQVAVTSQATKGKDEGDDGCMCPVCRDTYSAPMISPCGHALCQSCMPRGRSKCPVCRQPVHSSLYYKCYPFSKAIGLLHKEYADKPYDMDLNDPDTVEKYSAHALAQQASCQRAQMGKSMVEVILARLNLASTKAMNHIKITDSNMVRMFIRNYDYISDTLASMNFHTCFMDDDQIVITMSHLNPMAASALASASTPTTTPTSTQTAA